MCALFVVFEQLSSMVNYTAKQMCLLCNKSSSCQGRECRERERERAQRERERERKERERDALCNESNSVHEQFVCFQVFV